MHMSMLLLTRVNELLIRYWLRLDRLTLNLLSLRGLWLDLRVLMLGL
jgi:hypothetical protein